MGEGPTATTEEGVQGTQTAWHLLTSPRVFLGLTAVLGLVFAWAQTVPQRPGPRELTPLAPFAEVEALRSLGLDDVWVAWPVLLLALLLVLVAAGLLLLRAHRVAAAPAGPFATAAEGTSRRSLGDLQARVPDALAHRRVVVRASATEVQARRGYELEGTVVMLFGIAALIAALFIGRTNTFEARFELVPGSGDRSDLFLRDGDLFLAAARPLDLRCATPDPAHAERQAECTLVVDPASPPEPVTLRPGKATATDSGLTLTPVREALRFVGQGTFDLVLRRASGPERLSLEHAKPTELGATKDRLTAFSGPDGPMVVWQGPDGRAALLAAPTAATIDRAAAPIALEYVPRVTWTVAAEKRSETFLVWLGAAFLALGLLVLGLVPSMSISLAQTPNGTLVRIRSTNRPTLVAHARRVLLGDGA